MRRVTRFVRRAARLELVRAAAIVPIYIKPNILAAVLCAGEVETKLTDQTHELARGVSMVIWRTIGLGRNVPPWREDEEVRERRAGFATLGGQHAEDGRVDVIFADGANVDEAGKVVFVRHVVAVPSDDVEWTMRLG